MIESLDVSHLVVIEPHADDAFLCMGQHIEERKAANKQTTIWTIYSGTRKRAADAEAYAKAVGANWVGSGLVEGQPIDDVLTTSLMATLGAFLMDRGTYFALPLGITHPEHISVRAFFERVLASEVLPMLYLDQPYATTQKNGPRVTELLHGKRVVSFRRPGVRKYRHIPLFKDQAKFYHYNPVDKLIQTCELVVA